MIIPLIWWEQIDPSFMINLTTDGNEISCNNDSWGHRRIDVGLLLQASNSATVGVRGEIEVSLEEYLKYHISSILKMTESSKVERRCRWSYWKNKIRSSACFGRFK